MENFKAKFVEEATEHINDLESALLLLEKNSTDKALIERVFRAMHSLKGGGAMFGFEKISEFTHHLETVYDLVRNEEMEISENMLNLTLAAVDHLKLLLNEDISESEETEQQHYKLIEDITKLISEKESKSDNNENLPESAIEKTGNQPIKTYFIHFEPNEEIFNNGTNPLYLLDELNSLGESVAIPHLNKIPELNKLNPQKCYTYWEVFLATSEDINTITDVFIFVEEECTLEIQHLSDHNLLKNDAFVAKTREIRKSGKDIGITELQNFIKTISTNTRQLQKKQTNSKTNSKAKENAISSIRVSSDKLDHLMNLVSELVTTQARLSLFAEEEGNPELVMIAENVQKLSRQLRDNAFSIVLIPIENMLTRFQRLVRDLSSELKKEVTFITEGAETELDKTIIENLADPLMHILRNSLDHGIEKASEREKHGKPRQGKIVLKAFYSGASVHIKISDDGAGIDTDRLREKAIHKGLISADIQLSKKELLDLIFIPGFSTTEKITDVSGRGVGMDVVRRKISDIRGEVEVDSTIGAGTTITIKLPLTLSIIDGLLVRITDTHYVIPLSAVDKIFAVEHNKLVNTFNNLVILEEEQVPFYYLREEFGLPENTAETEQVVVVRYEEKRIGLTVDEVVGEYQAVLKPLGKYYKEQEIISGATILGDGTIALVLDTNKAIKQFSKQNIITEEITND